MHKTHAIMPLLLIGVVSSFVFVFTAWASGISPDQVIALANSARTKAGLATLSENPKLTLAAQSKAEDMIANDYFAHTSPTGVEPWYWVKQEDYSYKAAGENLAINYTNAIDQHDAWMKSPTHRANIMSERYQEIGVAVVQGKIDGKESTVTVQFFGQPLYAATDEATTPPPLPVPVEVMGAETTLGEGTPVVMGESLAPATMNAEKSLSSLASLASLAGTSWIELLLLLTLALVSFSTPIVFLAEAYMTLVTIRIAKKADKKARSVSVIETKLLHQN